MDREIVDLLVRFFVLTVSLSVHEFAHAWAAFRFGDDTAARMGRMTLNPVSHMDPIGSLMILAGMPLGWAKPVPVDPDRLRNPLRHGSWVALAGPASNVLLGLLFAALFWALSFQAVGTGWFLLLLYFIHINFALAVFNLLPLPPLDGARVVPLLLPKKTAERYEEIIARVGFWPLIVLFLLELPPQFKGPLHLWFELWSPLFQPVLSYLGVPAFW
jgi:Zn-dependent protease